MMKKKKTGAHLASNSEPKRSRRPVPEYTDDREAFLGRAEEPAAQFDAPAFDDDRKDTEKTLRKNKRARHEIKAEKSVETPAAEISPEEGDQEIAGERRKSRRKEKKSGGHAGITALIIVMVLALVVGGVGFAGYKITMSPNNLPNVYVDGIFVGGLTKEQTTAVLDENKWDAATKADLKVKLLKNVSFKVDMCKAGVLLTKDDAVEAAYRYGHDGNWFENFITYAAGLFGQVDVNETGTAINSEYINGLIAEALEKQDKATADNGYKVDEEKGVLTMVKGAGQIRMDPAAIYSAVLGALERNEKELSYTTLSEEPKMPDFQGIYDELAIEPVDAYYDYETKSIVDNVDGFTFDVKAAQDEWSKTAVTETVTVPVKITIPEVTTESLEEILFRDVLGSQETMFFTYDTNRCNNLNLAISKIDGIILNPGEEFSYNDTIGERTEEKGFLPAGAYDDGQVVQEIGGGVCQISSTLYSACIFAQMEILERTNHYFKVDYLDYCMDATVSWPSPNYRFRNNHDYPIKIHATYDGEYDTSVHQGAVKVEILGTDVDGTYVKVWNETWTIPHPEFPDIGIGYSKLQHRDVYSADGVLLHSDCYDYLDEYYFHEEVYAEKVEARRNAMENIVVDDGGGGGGEAEIDFG